MIEFVCRYNEDREIAKTFEIEMMILAQKHKLQREEFLDNGGSELIIKYSLITNVKGKINECLGQVDKLLG